ncbi:MAG: glycosyltransferase family 4 protein [Anaerolineales bacterium]|nr:glycosyltransferase family 4 protein [Anaerolineales bacterium]
MTPNQLSGNKSTTVALILNDVVGKNMAGTGIRYWEFARVLGNYVTVKLIVPPFVPMEDSVPDLGDLPASLCVCAHIDDFRRAVADCDVIVTSGLVLFYHPFVATLAKPLVLDLYAPFLLESLQRQSENDWLQQITAYDNTLSALRLQLRAGDFFICAGEKQRDYWLGMLSAMGRTNPYTYQQDASLRRLIDVAPYGLPDEPPRHTKAVLKGVYKTIAADDPVIIWTGGIWNWFDAQTLVKAMPLIQAQHPRAKLFFMGINRPNKNVSRMEAVDETIALSQALGLYDQSVFFNDWVPYEERQNYLLEADVGVSLHLDHIETRFSFRTRLLDHLWAGLPTVSTKGDVMGEALAAQNLSILVDPADVNGVAAAVNRWLNHPTRRAEQSAQFQRVAAQYHWPSVTQPLVNFCTNPHFAPDKAHLGSQSEFSQSPNEGVRLLGKGWRALRLGGISGLIDQGTEYIRWKVDKYQKL